MGFFIIMLTFPVTLVTEKVLKQSTDRSESINKVDVLLPSSVTNAQTTTDAKTSVQQIFLLQKTGVSDLNWYRLKACRQTHIRVDTHVCGHTQARTHTVRNIYTKKYCHLHT